MNDDIDKKKWYNFIKYRDLALLLIVVVGILYLIIFLYYNYKNYTIISNIYYKHIALVFTTISIGFAYFSILEKRQALYIENRPYLLPKIKQQYLGGKEGLQFKNLGNSPAINVKINQIKIDSEECDYIINKNFVNVGEIFDLKNIKIKNGDKLSYKITYQDSLSNKYSIKTTIKIEDIEYSTDSIDNQLYNINRNIRDISNEIKEINR